MNFDVFMVIIMVSPPDKFTDRQQGLLTWHTTLRLCEGLEFGTRLPGGNDDLKRNYENTEKFFRKSPAPNQS